MAGRIVDLKSTIPLMEYPLYDDYYPFYQSWLPRQFKELLEEVEKDVEIERFTDTPADCKVVDTPFAKSQLRSYWLKVLKWPVWPQQPPCEVYSMYRSLESTVGMVGTFGEPVDAAILLLAEGAFAGGVYKNGSLIATKEIYSRKVNSSKSEKLQYQQNVIDLLNKWSSLLDTSQVIFVCCSYEDKEIFFEGHGDTNDSKYKRVPFVTGRPSIQEVEKTFDRVTRVEFHGTLEEALANIKKERKLAQTAVVEVTSTTSLPSSSHTRRLEKKQWSWMDAKLAKRLVDYVENDNADGIFDEVQHHSQKSELLEYLKSTHEKFNDGSFLHFAAQKDAVSVIECLLEFGCDPCVKDSNNKVPFEYCQYSDAQQAFIEFRDKNPDSFNWNKSKVPETVSRPVHNERKMKENIDPKKSEISRKKRKEKLRKKKISNYLD